MSRNDWGKYLHFEEFLFTQFYKLDAGPCNHREIKHKNQMHTLGEQFKLHVERTCTPELISSIQPAAWGTRIIFLFLCL